VGEPVLDPAGTRAARIAELTWLMTGLAAVVVAIVGALLVLAIVRGVRRSGAVRFSETWLIVGGGIVLPAVILPVLWVRTLIDMRDLSVPPEPPALTVEVTARQWSYAVHYPDHGVAVTDELRIPAERVVLLRLRSDDVIHSFWAPRLFDKVDMIPGRTTEQWLSARPGTYLVQCSEFCGVGHAHHRLEIVAVTQAEFERWVRERRR
jgi:cytochrome c oxidase subunit II